MVVCLCVPCGWLAAGSAGKAPSCPATHLRIKLIIKRMNGWMRSYRTGTRTQHPLQGYTPASLCLSQQRESRAHSYTSMDKYGVCALVFAIGAFVQFHPVFTQDSLKIHPKPGECSRHPLLAPSKHRCVSDQDCPGDHKCCVFDCEDVCKPPAFNKAGVCPNTKGQYGLCGFLCFDDRDCSDEKKCCRNGCGGYNCMLPFKVKPGDCPLLQGECVINTCFHDGQCPGDQKCCQTACGHACQELI